MSEQPVPPAPALPPLAPGPTAPEFPVVPLTGTTELRIHGVSGTPVESMLFHPHPVQVSGDPLAGFYRRGDDHDTPMDPLPAGRNLEAYSWGGLTSGSSARAFWLLLVPFTLANVASWVHPVRPTARFAPVGAMSGVIRVFALSLTVTFMLATAGVGMDLLTWQCVNAVEACGDEHFYTRFMTEGGFWPQPGVRVAVGAVLPVLVLLALSYLSYRTGRSYEAYERKDEDIAAPEGLPLGAADLAQPKFWSGGAPFTRLRSLHMCTGLATVAGIVAYAAGYRDTGGMRVLGAALAWAAALLVLGSAAVLASPLGGRRQSLLAGREPARWLCVALKNAHWAGLAVLLAALAYAVGPADPDPGDSIALPGIGWLVRAVFIAQVSLLAVYFATAGWASRRSPSGGQTLVGRTLFRAVGAPVLAMCALGIAGAYASALVFRVADYLGQPVRRGAEVDGNRLEVLIHWPYYVAARTATVAAIALVVVVVAVKVWLRGRRRRCVATVLAEYGPAAAGRPERVREIANAQASAALTDRADAFLGGFLLLVVAGQLLLMAFWQVDREHYLIELATTAGTWLIGVVAVLLLLVARSAYGSSGRRRTVGIIWDLGTFWPRAAHPFAPPCYCERVVPEFTARVRRLTEAGGRVVISAHSQGTVIAAAAIHRLGPDACERVGLVTYGSPLDRLYARLFPHFFGAAALDSARRTLRGRWYNLYRRTDPIGGPVFDFDAEAFSCGSAAPAPPTATVDVRLPDPVFEPDEGEFAEPKARGHSDYFHDERFGRAVATVAASLD